MRYANPRVKDPCPQNSWPRMSNPQTHQKTAVLSYLAEIVNPKAIYFLPSMMVVELALNDGRSYETHLLPGTVAGQTTLYHHSETPFLHSMKDLHRERRLDPAKSEILGRCQRIAQTTFSSLLLCSPRVSVFLRSRSQGYNLRKHISSYLSRSLSTEFKDWPRRGDGG